MHSIRLSLQFVLRAFSILLISKMLYVSSKVKLTDVVPICNFRFCGMCSAKLRKGVRFCWKCNADQTSAGPPDESTSSGQQQESFGRPQMGQKQKAMSIESYMKAKSTERQSGSTFRSKKRTLPK